MKFVESLPRDGRTKSDPVDIDVLRRNPGKWAEVARYPSERKNNASSRGSYLCRTNPGVECATRTVDGETILFLRVAP